MKARICIVSQSHICRNPRVYKEATCLATQGYQVSILTAIYADELLKEDEQLLAGFSINYHFYSDQRKLTLRTLLDKSLKKIFTLLQVKFGLSSVYSLGYAPGRLKIKCKREAADLYIMHQEMPLVVGCKLLNEGLKVGFDLEDFYSEDLLPAARRQRPVKLLSKAESFALNKGAFTLTTSTSLSAYLTKKYGGKNPYVIRNVFPLPANKLMSNAAGKALKLYWFSQTIGPGRGLDLLIAAANKVSSPLEIHLRGKPVNAYTDMLRKNLKPHHQLVLKSIIPNAEIISDMQNYDIGLALEPITPLNKMLTTSNKLFHYLSGSLPVIISPTSGQKEIMALQEEPCIFLSEEQNADSLSEVLHTLIQASDQVKTLKERAYQLAERKFNWEMESKKLVLIIKRHLA